MGAGPRMSGRSAVDCSMTYVNFPSPGYFPVSQPPRQNHDATNLISRIAWGRQTAFHRKIKTRDVWDKTRARITGRSGVSGSRSTPDLRRMEHGRRGAVEYPFGPPVRPVIRIWPLTTDH